MKRHRHGSGQIAFLVAVVGLLVAPLPLAAQSQGGTGQIVGTVFDESGAVIPGAMVSGAQRATGLVRQQETNQAGQYRLVLLPPGEYLVVVKREGFKSAQTDITVNVGATVTVDVTLSVGQVTEVVEVAASALVNPTRSETDALINVNFISNLPIVGRRFHDFAVLTPTIQVEPQRSQISFVGQRGINGNVTIDGADYNQPFFGGIRGGERSFNAFTIPQESISEFQVVASGFSPEFGRSTGGLLNAVTKSGTNDWHGSAFYFLRHKELGVKDARDRLAITTLHQYGGSVGGPLVKGKSFLFGAFESQDNNNPRIVLFSSLAGLTPTAAQQEAFDFYQGLETPFTQTNDAWTFLVKWDHNFNPNHRVSARYNWSKNTGKNAVATGESIAPETTRSMLTNGTEGDETNTIVGNWQGVFSPTVINELRVLYSREDRPRTPNAEQPLLATSIGEFGTRSFLPTDQFDYRVQVADNLTWNPGSHSLKFGGEFNYLFADQTFGFNQFGAYNFFSSTSSILSVLSLTPGDPADQRFNNTSATYRLQIGNLLADMSLQEVALYFTDSWRINPRFTLNFGLRWEGYFNPTPDANNTSLVNLVASTTFPLGSVDPRTINDNTDQVMPRLGFAWDPWGDGKSVVRGNVGIYYARNPLLLMAGPINNFRTPPGDVSVQLPFSGAGACNTIYCQFLAGGIDLNNFTLDNLPLLTPADLTAIATALGLSPDPFLGANLITWQDDYDSPRSLNWNAAFERVLFSGFKAGVDFTYLNTVHLERNRNLNLPAPFLVAGDASQRPCFGLRSTCSGLPVTQQSRPIPTLADVTIRESSARSVYRAVTWRGELRRNRYQFQAFYTWSKNTSDDDNERSAGGFTYDNGFNLIPEYGNSSLDARHQFRFNGLAELPFGITLSGSTFLRSGLPIDPTATGGDENADRGGPDRPFQAPGVPYKRNSFRDEPFYEVNFRAAKRFYFGEERRFDITFDFFNLFDNDNIRIGSLNARWGNLGVDPATGSVLPAQTSFLRTHLSDGTIDPRNEVARPFQVQVGLRFVF